MSVAFTIVESDEYDTWWPKLGTVSLLVLKELAKSNGEDPTKVVKSANRRQTRVAVFMSPGVVLVKRRLRWKF